MPSCRAAVIIPSGGKGVSQGTFRCDPPDQGCQECQAVHHPGGKGPGSCEKRRESGSDNERKHTRECFVVAEEGADRQPSKKEIVTMPNYFADYDTTVHLSARKSLQETTAPSLTAALSSEAAERMGERNSHIIEYSLKLDSNPEFTSSVRWLTRERCTPARRGQTGCRSVFDIGPAYLSAKTGGASRYPAVSGCVTENISRKQEGL